MYTPVSVVIPCYRCSETIHRAVSSVIDQTCPPREIFLIDDHSNDEEATLSAIKQIKQLNVNKNIKIEVVALEENSGPSVARNIGWDMAREPYIAFLDADDSWHKRKLEIQYQWMIANPQVAISGHRSQVITTHTTVDKVGEELSCIKIAGQSMLIANPFPTRSVMLKRDIPCRFHPQKRHAEDYLLWMQIVFGGWQAFFLESTLAYSYKEEYGKAGLSQSLWKMEMGVQDSLKRIYQEKKISWLAYVMAKTFSILKFIRRFALTHAFFSWKRSRVGTRQA